MADLKLVLSDPKTGKAYNIEATGGMAGALIGKKIGQEISGDAFGFAGYTIELTGATDRTGIPAREDLPGAGRRKILLSESTGFHPKYPGQRCRKAIRCAEITPEFVQVNAKVVGYGAKSLEEYFAPAEAEAPAAE
ncbi:MAG: 30S ribosomal protein S6e [Methanomicrobium sp.]|jgi:small subunit ribosomal protein S6e|uniref:30S ribosomal protein S6e n=1 Tax=Methanomicrobium mobile TaxID=2205 RepID=UPI0005B2D37E|nr:30S ribosomal protein S6e [Methanomicrobium mobile]MBO7388346.1 30S ribosomal protein S6e [Methanomicrobium sp.]MBP5083185.1 30S ribosomal protein S6e [Methanomicrobium sp.]MBP5475831.1 30S ribosomal protein S6e [Methanomicrobium sp.]